MIFQTAKGDLEAGWRRFRDWAHGFAKAADDLVVGKNSDDLLFLAKWPQIGNIDELGIHDIDRNVDEKLAFMHSYLTRVALESRHFEADVQSVLEFQSRVAAARSLGFWFWQSDIAKFGAGTSPIFQGNEISLFTDVEEHIDFADVYAILPFDCAAVRNPSEKWTTQRVKKLVARLEWDLGFDGMEAKVSPRVTAEILWLVVVSPDLGIG
jgi:hypothetical protein